MNSIGKNFWTELAQIQEESIGWVPLYEGTYMHIGFTDVGIQVVGVSPQ
jgi:hypothetical protein